MSIRDHAQNSITVQQLIDQLQQFDPNQLVGFAFPSHDHWRTQLVGMVSNVDTGTVRWSDYHSQFREVDYEDDPEVRDQEVVIIDI